MEQLLQQAVNGISLGSIYALIALGYTMVYGIINLINFAHGEVLMVGAYIGLYLTSVLGLPFLPALLLSMVLSGVLGMVIEKVAYKPLRNGTRISALITAIAVSLFMQYGMMYFVGPESRTYKDLLPSKQIDVFSTGALIDIKSFYIIFITLIMMLLLMYLTKFTKMGKSMRALSQDRDAAELMGINVNQTISYTFFIGSSLAGAAGVLIGVYYSTINPLMGATPGLKAFVSAVIGGIGIIPGAVFGGFFLGIVETAVSAFGGSLYKDAVAFFILIVFLLVKPSGLLGKNTQEKV
ncbi:branched-chain amino acid ABC transporter permease [Proteiniclasticum ruminis]|uniref:Amino acid/amide ABC transporter membrane protein 1, HAAT family n=1 Tax=Proteiniclasticum ruminis TaxID=398199 RepID=A0A1I4YGN0_9CLOT|nr:branched-chain amino acid ABC transporter permease [Proteiniclasticum ruminis]SFN37201.1 amino acid/amide ABC transporter membrane protein 1, HAAT family [Proteiniclasticum ruminis]